MPYFIMPKIKAVRAAAVYCRLSQDRTGVGVVVQRQERESRELAARLGWPVVAVFSDNDMSASTRKPRPDYRRMLAAIDAGEVDAILVWNVDRLYRRLDDLEELVDVAERSSLSIQVVTSGEIDLSTVNGRLMARTLGVFAKAESERIAERTLSGKRDAASRGGYSGGPAPWGYRVVPAAERKPDGPVLAVVPEQAEALREAAAAIISGDSLRSLAMSFNRRDLTTARGHLWTGSALRKALLKPSIAGFSSARGEIIARGAWEPILDEGVWRGVTAVLSDPARRTTDQRARKYLLSGLALCGVCGHALIANSTAGGGPGARRTAYRCRQGDLDGRVHVVRDQVHLDAFVEELVRTRLAEPDAVALSAPPQVDTSGLLVEGAALRARQDELARGWALDLSMTRAQLTAATQALAGRLAEVESAVAAANSGSVLAGLVGEDAAVTAATWAEMSLDRRRAVVSLLVTVTVFPRTKRGRLPGGLTMDPDTIRAEWTGEASGN